MGLSYSEQAARLRVPLGFALGVAYLVLAQPTLRLLGIGAAIALAGLVARGWAAGCLDKNQRLATGGPYAYTRNPLYLGSLLLGLGFAVAGGSWALGIAFLALFLLVYWPVMRREEDFLRQTFGEVYDRYAVAVPFLFPVRSKAAPTAEEGGGFQWARYKRNREYQAALGYVAGVVLLVLKLALR
ncbi:MAG TPA: isoprenylcysteine carboxylmethyltransferase family protein [Terriglobia bacterium]|nr:isoprenylcysteine carboxylmethyltransferase family protein [Terriglobia bacterium]